MQTRTSLLNLVFIFGITPGSASIMIIASELADVQPEAFSTMYEYVPGDRPET